jgi:hypothetical protein
MAEHRTSIFAVAKPEIKTSSVEQRTVECPLKKLLLGPAERSELCLNET